MFEIPQSLIDIVYMKGIDLYLWVVCIVACFTSGILLFVRAGKFEAAIQKRLFIGYALFCIFYGITRIFFSLAPLQPDNYDEWNMAGYVAVLTAMVFLAAVLECYLLKAIVNTHFIVTIASLVMLGVSIAGLLGFIERATFLDFIYIVAFADAAVVAILYLYLIIKGVGSVRNRMILSFFGIVVLFLGMALDSELALTMGIIPLWLPPIVTTVGIVMFLVSQIQK